MKKPAKKKVMLKVTIKPVKMGKGMSPSGSEDSQIKKMGGGKVSDRGMKR